MRSILCESNVKIRRRERQIGDSLFLSKYLLPGRIPFAYGLHQAPGKARQIVIEPVLTYAIK